MTSHHKLHQDFGLLLLKLLMLAAYISLLFIKPAGEGWGRGWNLVAYWMYVTPTVLVLGGLHVWRQRTIAKKFSSFDALMTVLAFIFPLVSLAVLKFKT
jgi:hypothetical protein